MYKVLIVDDEPAIRQGLATLIPWEEFGFDLVNTAVNGRDALEKHHQMPPHLMIVDIKMPGMSGIELMEKIRKIDEKVHFLILSGYAEFDHAKKAIAFGVDGYLLKPVVEEELMEYLTELKPKLEHEEEYLRLQTKIEGEHRNKLIHAVLMGDQSEEIQAFIMHQLDWDHYQILLMQIDARQESNTVINKLQTLLKKMFPPERGIVFSFSPYLGILLHVDFTNKTVLHQSLQAGVDKENFDWIAALSEPTADIENLPAVFQAVSSLLQNRFFYEENELLTSDSKPFFRLEQEKEWKREKINPSKEVDKLLYAIDIGDQQSIERICVDIAKKLVYSEVGEAEIKRSFIHLLSTVFNKLMYQYKDKTEMLSSILIRVMEIEKRTTIKQLLTYVHSLVMEVVEQMDDGNSDIIVKKMMNLIERHYDKHIKLDSLAEILNYNRAYLGQLFKDYTGEYFNTYLDKVRIENGKRLLLQDLKIYQVAERVGYSNVDYFHGKFKKYVGMTPTEYRKSKKRKQEKKR
ncbi:response regulator transcription factor [Lederbergia sp. NSJ-179]|uniref:response regulator transcription factor n=1 Tax=Lederbergia sp. NSJ-179 TaxID=2931402 RepID=UPI001FCF87CC|nr:response regulator transcription factor [Lederbergia sp. NSJ-179]MCJ7840161.1 response regulator transcription factor [Lederbergia sp. NSJ-179]